MLVLLFTLDSFSTNVKLVFIQSINQLVTYFFLYTFHEQKIRACDFDEHVP